MTLNAIIDYNKTMNSETYIQQGPLKKGGPVEMLIKSEIRALLKQNCTLCLSTHMSKSVPNFMNHLCFIASLQLFENIHQLFE